VFPWSVSQETLKKVLPEGKLGCNNGLECMTNSIQQKLVDVSIQKLFPAKLVEILIEIIFKDMT